MPRKKIVIIILSRNHLMDFAGPADVFTHANELRDCYEIELVSPTDNLTGFYGGVDTLLLTGNDNAPGNDVFFSWLRGEHDNIRRIGFVGVGSAILEKKVCLSTGISFIRGMDMFIHPAGYLPGLTLLWLWWRKTAAKVLHHT